MQKIINAYFIVCVGILGYSGWIITQIREADRIQLQIEDQLDPMFNGLMDKVYTGQVWPDQPQPAMPQDLETLRYRSAIENSLEAN